MKKCRTIEGLKKALKNGEIATLKVWDIMENSFIKGGAYLNMGESAYVSVGKEGWEEIRNHVVNHEGVYFKNILTYKRYFCMSREEKVKKLLEPITWEWDTSLNYRKRLVSNRYDEVKDVYPLLTDDEKKLADKWLENEKHSGLWD